MLSALQILTYRVYGPLAQWLQEVISAVCQGGIGVLSGMQPVSDFHGLELLFHVLVGVSQLLESLDDLILPVVQPCPAFKVDVSTVECIPQGARCHTTASHNSQTHQGSSRIWPWHRPGTAVQAVETWCSNGKPSRGIVLPCCRSMQRHRVADSHLCSKCCGLVCQQRNSHNFILLSWTILGHKSSVCQQVSVRMLI